MTIEIKSHDLVDTFLHLLFLHDTFLILVLAKFMNIFPSFLVVRSFIMDGMDNRKIDST